MVALILIHLVSLPPKFHFECIEFLFGLSLQCRLLDHKWSVQVPERLHYVLMFKNLQNSIT